MRATLIITTLLLAGCGSFPLGTSYPDEGQTQEQLRADILWCKDQAHMAADTTSRQVGSFLAGMTIIGAPVAIADERRFQREYFAKCMTDKGYRVEAPK